MKTNDYNITMYKFEPLLKQTIWGGDKIIPFKHLDSKLENVGESWEISGVKDSETIVANGPYKGLTLNQLVAELKDQLVGKENYERFGNEFPLLIKFIDARQNLSIQVHPDDETAHRHGKERGKTEMWYCVDVQKCKSAHSYLYNGLKMRITPDTYKEMVEKDTITEALARYEVFEGDVFFIPAGRIHAIGAGCFVLEIQQTSDVTYRIYDYKRKDKNGNYRELHTKEAAESIDYNVLPDYRTSYEPKQNEGVQVVSCPYFTTAVYDLDQATELDYTKLDSFVILIGLGGAAIVTEPDGTHFVLRAGETVLLPASATTLKVEGNIKFLETYAVGI